MGKLIDVDDLKRDLLERGFYPVIVKNALEAAPEAVVRCKDCEWWFDVEGDEDKFCVHPNGLDYGSPDDFCSLGKWRSDDE